MSTYLRATRRSFGIKRYENIIIKVPDKVYEKLKNFTIEIIDYNSIGSERTAIFLNKEEKNFKKEITSISFNNKYKDCFTRAIKQLYEELENLNHLEKK